MELSTTHGAGGDITARVPGAQAGGQYGDLFASLIKQRQAAQPRTVAPRAEAAPTYSAAPSYDSYVPQAPRRDAGSTFGGGAPSAMPITRMRDVPQNPYDAMSRIPGGIGGTGNTNTAKVERYIPGVGWEFDGIDSMNPRGGSGGIQGGGAFSSLHSSEFLGGPGPADPIAAQRDDFDPKTGQMLYRAPIKPQVGKKY